MVHLTCPTNEYMVAYYIPSKQEICLSVKAIVLNAHAFSMCMDERTFPSDVSLLVTSIKQWDGKILTFNLFVTIVFMDVVIVP